jgi:hypothetical protein
VRYQFRPVRVQGCESSDFHMLCVDLASDADAILSKIHRETRYKIRRGEAVTDGHNGYVVLKQSIGRMTEALVR